MASDVCVERRRRRAFVWGCTLSLAFSFLPSSADAEELIQPPVCSADKNTAGKTPRGTDVCSVTPIGVDANGVEHHEVKIDLTANTAPIQVGGYKVITENYNGAYLPPIVEAMPGDVVAARLENLLEPRQPDSHGMAHETTPGENPTNLHYFHGGIVTPRNSRPGDDGGDPKNLGDNVYASLKNGKDASGSPNSFEFNVPIPGNGELDARVLEDSDPSGMIAHPPGLNWYHSHLHGISARQVGGGMSGLLSVGGAKANVGGKTPTDTQVLRKRTDVSYLMLRDLPILSETSPENAKGDAAAEWRLPTEKNPRANACALSITDIPKPEESDRKGFCWAESEPKSIWLFTINGLRYPTITIDPGRNRLLRIANLSANFTYTLTIVPKNGGEPFKFDLLSVDGVVPGNPLSSSTSEIPVEATPLTQLLLMPASRAEIYVRNDGEDAVSEREYVLRTEELHTSKVGPDGTWIGPGDDWPQIQLARIVFKARPPAAPQIAVALNTIRSEPTHTATPDAPFKRLSIQRGAAATRRRATPRRSEISAPISSYMRGSSVRRPSTFEESTNGIFTRARPRFLVRIRPRNPRHAGVHGCHRASGRLRYSDVLHADAHCGHLCGWLSSKRASAPVGLDHRSGCADEYRRAILWRQLGRCSVGLRGFWTGYALGCASRKGR